MKRRHVLAVLALSYLTFGIYLTYWLYRTRLDLLQHTTDKKAIPRVIVLFIPIFVLIALIIPSLILAVSVEGSAGSSDVIVGLFSFIFIVGGFLAVMGVSLWWFYRYFQVLERVVQGNDGMLYYILWIALTLFTVGPAWVVLVQSDLNKFIENGYRPLRVPMQPNYHPAGQGAPAHSAHPPNHNTAQHHVTHPHHQTGRGQHPTQHQS